MSKDTVVIEGKEMSLAEFEEEWEKLYKLIESKFGQLSPNAKTRVKLALWYAHFGPDADCG